MTTPMNNKTIKFSDDKISVLIRNCVVDRDQIKNIKNSYLTLEDVPFGVAKNVLRHTHVDVQICKCKDIWEHVLCGDEESLIKAYNTKVECGEPEVETKEEAAEEPVTLTQPNYVWDNDQETTDSTSDSVEEDSSEEDGTVTDSEEDISDVVDAHESDENSTNKEDTDDPENESDDESDDKVETEEVTDQSQETSNYNASNNGERVVRRQVNMNNHKKHRH